MDPKKARELLGGYATGTLSEAERQALLDAALEDQELFDDLMKEEELRALLELPGAKADLLKELQPRETVWSRFWNWMRTPTGWSAAGALATTAVLLVVIGVPRMEKQASITEVARKEPSRLMEPPATAKEEPAKDVEREARNAPAPRRISTPAPASPAPKQTTTPPPIAATAPQVADTRLQAERDEKQDEKKMAKAEAGEPVLEKARRAEVAEVRQDAAPAAVPPPPSPARVQPFSTAGSSRTADATTQIVPADGRTIELRQSGERLLVVSTLAGALSAFAPSESGGPQGRAVAAINLRQGVPESIEWGSAERLILVFEPAEQASSQNMFRAPAMAGRLGVRAKAAAPPKPPRVEVGDAPVRTPIGTGAVTIEVVRKR